MRATNTLIISVMLALLASCANIPKGVTAVSPFEKEKYLGKWFEIARFDFRFEKGLNNTTAEYSLNSNGTIKVVNRGYNYEKKYGKKQLVKQSLWATKKLQCLKSLFLDPFMRATMSLPSTRNTNMPWSLVQVLIIYGFYQERKPFLPR